MLQRYSTADKHGEDVHDLEALLLPHSEDEIDSEEEYYLNDEDEEVFQMDEATIQVATGVSDVLSIIFGVVIILFLFFILATLVNWFISNINQSLLLFPI